MAEQAAPPGTGAKPTEVKKGGGLFGAAKPAAGPKNQIQDIILQLNDVSRRLLVLEERYMNLRKKTQLTDQNMIENNKEFNKQIADLKDVLTGFRHDMSDINDKMKAVIRELQDGAKKQDVDVLKKYVDVWNPVDFVTRNEIFRLIKDQVETTMMDLNIKLQQEDYIKEQVDSVVKKILKK